MIDIAHFCVDGGDGNVDGASVYVFPFFYIHLTHIKTVDSEMLVYGKRKGQTGHRNVCHHSGGLGRFHCLRRLRPVTSWFKTKKCRFSTVYIEDGSRLHSSGWKVG